MSKLFNKASIAVAELPKKERKFNPHTLTTQSFFQLTPVLVKDLYVGDDIKVSGESFSRLLPLQSPAFATCDNYLRAFFVPYRTIQPSWLDYTQNSLHINAQGSPSIPTHNRFCLYGALARAFFTSLVFTQEVNAAADADFIFDYYNGGTTAQTHYYKLNTRGSQVYKVLQGLGYDLVPTDAPAIAEKEVNLLPLMSYLRVFMDWYFPRNYAMNAEFANIASYFARDNGDEQFNQGELRQMLSAIGYTYYEDDPFVEGWDNPSGPNSGNFSLNGYVVPDDSSSSVKLNEDSTSPYYGTPALKASGSGASLSSITKLGLNLLSSFSDFLKRNQLAGTRGIDRFLVRHGFKVDPAKVNRSYFLGEQRFAVGISDVAATIEDSNNNLGDLAGKGISKGSCLFECSAGDDRGFFMILLSSIPDADLVQGSDKNIYKTRLLQHYLPEYAYRGVDLVSASEIFTPRRGSQAVEDRDDIITKGFCFLPAWYEYNMMRSRLLGDYRVKSRGGLKSGVLQDEHTFRLFDDTTFGTLARMVHSLDFQSSSDRDQYLRLTYVGQDIQDFMRMFIEWHVTYNSSIPLIKDSYNFEDNGSHASKEVTVENSSVSFN